MTIILTAVVPDGIVMAGEGRCIMGPVDARDKFNFDFVTDGEEKIYLLGDRDRYGLAYSGPSFNDSGSWYINNDVNKLNQLVHQGNYSINDLAKVFADMIKQALPPGTNFSFHLATFQNYLPLVVTYQKGQLTNPLGFQVGRRPGYISQSAQNFGQVRFGLAMDGETNIIRKLLKNERIPFSRMSLRDAIEFCELTVTVGYKYLQYFGYQQVSGGPVDILVLTQKWSGFVKHKVLDLFKNKPETAKE